jgi:hypothetical protein
MLAVCARVGPNNFLCRRINLVGLPSPNYTLFHLIDLILVTINLRLGDAYRSAGDGFARHGDKTGCWG